MGLSEALTVSTVQENEFTELVLGGELADELEAEMHARIASTDQGVPRRVDQYLYFWYRQEDQQFKVHARSGSLTATQQYSKSPSVALHAWNS